MSAKLHLLLIEDNLDDVVLFRALTRKVENWQVHYVSTLRDGVMWLKEYHADIVVLDLELPDSGGLQTLASVRAEFPHMPILVLSGMDNEELAIQSLAHGAQDYLVKGDDLRLVRRGVRYAIERSRHEVAARELHTAGLLQQSFFPTSAPDHPLLETAGMCRPALDAGGDYYDFFKLANGHLAMVIADVAGHGIGPALVMSELRATLRTLAITYGDVGYILTRANQVLAQDLKERFITVMIAALHPTRPTVQYSGAGHQGLWFDASGQLIGNLDSSGPPLGVVVDWEYSTSTSIELSVGDSLLMVTDGFVECFNPQMEQYGNTRLNDTVAEHYGERVHTVLEQLYASCFDFMSNQERLDDMTAVMARCIAQTPHQSPPRPKLLAPKVAKSST